VIRWRDVQAAAQDRLVELLEAASYPVRDLDQHAFGQADTEIEATLCATAVDADADELDRVVAQLERHPGVLQAFWNAWTEN